MSSLFSVTSIHLLGAMSILKTRSLVRHGANTKTPRFAKARDSVRYSTHLVLKIGVLLVFKPLKMSTRKNHARIF